MIWREKKILLIVLGVLLAANTFFFLTYRVQYQNRLDELEARLKDSEASLVNARATRVRTERQLAGYRQVEQDVAQIYDKQWATQDERLTSMIAEVKRLALASELQPRTYGFDRADAKGAARTGTTAATPATTGTRRKPLNAVEVGVSFGVQGNYQQARRLINLLELSPQFIIIDRVDLAAREGDQLNLNLHVKTLFKNTLPASADDRRS